MKGSRTLRVGMVTQWFDPEGGSAAVPGIVARSLRRQGMHVEVLTGFPNYPEGKIYPGYRQRLYSTEDIDGIVVHRTPLVPNHGSRSLQRALSYLSFAGSAGILGLPRFHNLDVLLVYSTPVTVGVGPTIQRYFSHTPFVTFIQDLWPDTLTSVGITGGGRASSAAKCLASSVSNWMYRKSDSLAVISPGMKDRLIQRGHAADKIHVVPNWLPEDAVRPPFVDDDPSRSPEKGNKKIILTYAGNLGEAQGVRVILEAANLLKDRGDIHFQIVGSGFLEKELKSMAQRLLLSNVSFLGRRPNSDIPSLIATSDAQLVTLANSDLFSITTPSKVQYSLAFGRPIIAAVRGDAERVLSKSGAALCGEPENPEQMVENIDKLASLSPAGRQMMGTAGRRFFDQEFSEDVGSQRLMHLLEKAARVKSRP